MKTIKSLSCNNNSRFGNHYETLADMLKVSSLSLSIALVMTSRALGNILQLLLLEIMQFTDSGASLNSYHHPFSALT